jgi:hypothetical protein
VIVANHFCLHSRTAGDSRFYGDCDALSQDVKLVELRYERQRPILVVKVYQHLFGSFPVAGSVIGASRTPLWLPSGCRGRSLPQREKVFVGASKRTRAASASAPCEVFACRTLAPATPAALALPSSSSTRCRCGREFSETRRRQRCLVRLPSMPTRAHIHDRGRKYC